MTEADSRARVRKHRDRLRAQGLRPLQIWVPDTSAPDFVEEAHRQSRAVSESPRADDDQGFVDAISAWPDDEDSLREAR
jgi:hypothetical protein